MLGAIIGDLAAWTYEHEPDVFWKQLVSPEAKLSECGASLLYITHLMQQRTNYSHEDNLRAKLQTYLRDLNRYAYQPIFPETSLKPTTVLGCLSGYIHSSWTNTPGIYEDYAMWNYFDDSNMWLSVFNGEKAEGYSRQLTAIIARLRAGSSKKDALKGLHYIEDFHKDENMLANLYSLTYVSLAWHCFEKSFDFTSALHNAMRAKGNKHLTAMLTGAFAAAMYGCENILLKKKYSPETPYQKIALPTNLTRSFPKEISHIESHSGTLFFTKNSALTNVERHQWIPTNVADYSTIHFSREAYRRFLKSYYTGWENRYGLYWDNGWFYAYRSGSICCRFQLNPNEDGTYSIGRLDLCDDQNIPIQNVLEEIIHCTLFHWQSFGDEKISTTLMHMFKFYKGEEECPQQLRENDWGKWWLWEQMVYKSIDEDNNVDSIQNWWKMTDEAIADWRKTNPGFCIEEIYVLDYFAHMRAKCMPNDDTMRAIKSYIKY